MGVRVLALAIIAVLVPAGSAAASTADFKPISGSEFGLVFTAGLGERNDLAMRALGGDTYELTDRGSTVVPGVNCTAVDPHTVRCIGPGSITRPASPVTQFVVNLGDGDDRVTVDGPSIRLLANGGPGADELVGGRGDDLLDGGSGRDVMRGGPGTDTLSYATRVRPVVLALARREGHGEAGEGDVASEFENLLGGSGDDRLVGDSGPNLIDGRFGRDRLIGRAGDDTLTAGGGRTSCGDGRDSVVSLQLGAFGSELVDHVERDCEWIGLFDALTAQPAVRSDRDWIGLRISCPQPAPCSVRARVFSATQRLLAEGRIGRGTWSRQLVRLRLTERGRRRLASSSGRAVRIEVRVGRRISRWTAHLDPPA